MNLGSKNLFETLALKVKDEWSQRGQDLDAFVPLATQALESFEYNLTQDQFDAVLADWLLTSGRIPEQINLHNTFGEPPVTIYNDGRFVVDLYIWIGCDTSIHSHGFRGAFRVLHGRSLHETFRAKVIKQVAPDVEITELARPNLELLKVGDVRRILPGKELTHRVIHLDEPTITLCIKTINEDALSQWHHFTNGLAIQKRHLEPDLIKQLYYFQYLTNQNGRRADPFLVTFLDNQDISTLMNLAEELSMGRYEISDDVVQYILEKIYERFDDSEWFKLYQESAEAQASEINFSRYDSPAIRLAAHLLNSKAYWSQASPLLNSIHGKEISKSEIEKSLETLSGDPHSFLEK